MRIVRSVGTLAESESWPGGRYYVVCSGTDCQTLSIVRINKGGHATMTAGVATASGDSGNAAPGVAPGASLLIVDTYDGGTGGSNGAGSALDGIVLAARQPQVDIISMSVAVLRERPETGDLFTSLLLRRVRDVYNKLVINSAGNSHNSTGASAGDAALIVGASYSKETAAVMFQQGSQARGGVWTYSSRGPYADGDLRAALLGPVGRITPGPCENGVRLPSQHVRLLPCYTFAGGTSGAAPTIAGLAASLWSGARQAELPITAERLAWALRASARPLPGYGAVDQGAGVPQADVAWQLLSSAEKPIHIESTTRSSDALQRYLKVPHVGYSINERDGWVLGKSGRRTLTFRRLDGDAAPERFAVTFSGNDGTFSAPADVLLPYDRAVDLQISIHPQSAGIHSAMLELRNARGVVVHAQPVTIVGSTRPSAEPVRESGSLPLLDRVERPLVIEPGTAVLRLTLDVSFAAHVSFTEPAGWDYHRYNVPFALERIVKPGHYQWDIPDPTPGTWSFLLTHLNAYPPEIPRSTSYSYEIREGRLSTPHARSSDATLDITAPTLGSLDGSMSVMGTPVVCRRERLKAADDYSPLVRSVEVAPGTAALLLRACTSRDADAGLHMYVYNCSSGSCMRFDAEVPAAPCQSLAVARPAPGTWRSVLTSGPGATLRDLDMTFEVATTLVAAGEPLTPQGTADAAGRRTWEGHYNVPQVPLEPGRSRAIWLQMRAMDPSTGPNRIVPFGVVLPFDREQPAAPTAIDVVGAKTASPRP